MFPGKRLQADYRGSRDRYVLGGMHMTMTSFLPNAIMKEITATEYTANITELHLDNFTLDDLNTQQEMIYKMALKPGLKLRVDTMEAVADVERWLPWFLACNPDRFPYWWGRPDPRNVDLLEAMTSDKTRRVEGQPMPYMK